MVPSASPPDGRDGANSVTVLTENTKAIAPPSSQSTTRVDITLSTPPEPEPEPEADHEEFQYLNLIRRIIAEGEHRPDRTGTGTLSIFAPPQLRFSLSRPDPDDPSSHIAVLPLLTTKRVFLRAVTTELLWFVSGCTSSVPLSEAGIHIWDGNGSREYLDKLGFTARQEGDLGPVYGFQWRHFGAEYIDCHADYSGKGVDQIREIVRKLKQDPFDRRIILSAWNVADLNKMALPPCHMFAQFYVSYPQRSATAGAAPSSTSSSTSSSASTSTSTSTSTTTTQQPDTVPPQINPKGHLSCLLYQRSCDMGLGVPFNIASYALLTHMLAHACDLVPHTLIHTMGDAHVYLDHVDALTDQLARHPRPFPHLSINRSDRGSGVMDAWRLDDFLVTGYTPHGGIRMKMSV